MPYRKRYYKRVSNPDKYSIEHTVFNGTSPTTSINSLYQSDTIIVPATLTQGMRKVKHLTISLGSSGTTSWYWAVVYVPYTQNPSALNGTSGGALYEPSQFVMGCGIIDLDAGPNRIHIPLSRNLNQGDSIHLILGSTGAGYTFNGIVQYAITYN